jgi:hypothetical protein
MSAGTDYVIQKHAYLVSLKMMVSNRDDTCCGGQSGEIFMLFMPLQLKKEILFRMRDRWLHRPPAAT